jgi:hypothetical protein
MKITRHNYEEFFLLYVDNELSSEDRRMVEDFVHLHPDLKEELELFSQFKLTPDEAIVFDNKEELLKAKGETPITINNYEESLLSYIDNELTAEQRIAVEQFVNTNPVAKKELERLQQTKLQPETIVFADKASLYRKEEKVRSMPVRWWRAAAAILILGLGLTAALVITNKSADDKPPVAKNPGTEKIIPPANKTDQPVKEAMATTNPAVVTDNNKTTTILKDNQAVLPDYTPKKNTAAFVKENKPNKTSNDQLPVKKEEAVMADANKKPTNNLPTPVNNPNVIDNNFNNNKAIADINTTNTKKDIITNPEVTNQTAPPSNIVQASYNNEELVQSDGKKNKLRGLFRKAARTFEKRTDIDPTDNDNRLLVGGFAIRLK